MYSKDLVKTETISLPTQFGHFLLTTYIVSLKDQPNMRYIIAFQTHKLPEIPLIRIHSTCLFGETFDSMLCDCGEQLIKSLKLIGKKQGILFYLDQEGRGHGLVNKILEYMFQEKGSDTIQASQKLNLPIDSRKYTMVAQILELMGIKKVKLITNNPQKISDLEKEGIKVVERVVIKPTVNKYNYKYLKIKKEKLHHLIDI